MLHILEFLTASKGYTLLFRLCFRHDHWLNCRYLIGEMDQINGIDVALARLLGYLEAYDKSGALAEQQSATGVIREMTTYFFMLNFAFL